MDVTEALVRHVARLARLELTDAEVAQTVPQLARILAHVESVASLDVAGADPAAIPPVPVSALRPDVVAPGLERRDVARERARARPGLLPRAARARGRVT